jgi:hypothetical protein
LFGGKNSPSAQFNFALFILRNKIYPYKFKLVGSSIPTNIEAISFFYKLLKLINSGVLRQLSIPDIGIFPVLSGLQA